jgi:Uma2 family endonuclease
MPSHREPPESTIKVADPLAPPVDDPTPTIYQRPSDWDDSMFTIAGQTEEDFFLYAPDHGYCEYIDGIVYMPSPVKTRHQEIVLFLAQIFDGLRWESGTGRVLTGPAVLHLAPNRNPEPDIFVQPVGTPPPEDGMRNQGAVLVVEVLSPSNRGHDLDTKAKIYREAAIPEIWYVDDREGVLRVERREGEDYQTLQLTEGIHLSTALPGFWIDVSWLWADPLPNPRRCLETILAGPPPA